MCPSSLHPASSDNPDKTKELKISRMLASKSAGKVANAGHTRESLDVSGER